MKLFARNAGLIAASVAAGMVITLSVEAFAEKATAKLPLEDIRLFADVLGAVKSYYVDDIDDSVLIENATRGLVEGLDPHSSFLNKKAFQDMEESTTGEFGGLGIEITKDPAGIRVVTPIDDTPAARAGVMAGDLITKLDEKSTSGMSLNESVKIMRGTPGTSIELTIARKGVMKPVVVRIERAIIKVQSVKSKELQDGIGYVRISQFQERTANDMARVLQKFSAGGHLRGLVLDLRNNPGGLLNAAVGVCAAYLPPGSLVVSTRGREESSERKFSTVPGDYAVGRSGENQIAKLPQSTKTVPIVVLVNSASASASEIVSGALQDHKRAVIMGSRTFGKGSVQTIIPLRREKNSTIGVKLTTARYYTPSGRTIQAKGILPDIIVDDTPEGNYPSFKVREADFANHIDVESDEEEEHSGEDDFTVANDRIEELRYTFGEEKDFPLQQAIAHLQGRKVVTHEETAARLKAQQQAAEKGGTAGGQE